MYMYMKVIIGVINMYLDYAHFLPGIFCVSYPTFPLFLFGKLAEISPVELSANGRSTFGSISVRLKPEINFLSKQLLILIAPFSFNPSSTFSCTGRLHLLA